MGIQTTQGGEKDNWMLDTNIVDNTPSYTPNISSNYLNSLLHSSTYDPSSEDYADYEYAIEHSNYDDKLDLLYLLLMNHVHYLCQLSHRINLKG